MILVLLGTQDKPFLRLLKMVSKEIDKGNIKEKVVAQTGYTTFSNEKITTFDFKSKDEIVLETAKMYMKTLDEMFDKEFINPKPTIKEALQRGFDVVCEQRNELRYIYQVISSPKYGAKSRSELSRIYSKYLDYSKKFAEFYNVDHSKFRPYFLLFVATIHDYCLWENNELVNEKLEYIYKKVDELD